MCQNGLLASKRLFYGTFDTVYRNIQKTYNRLLLSKPLFMASLKLLLSTVYHNKINTFNISYNYIITPISFVVLFFILFTRFSNNKYISDQESIHNTPKIKRKRKSIKIHEWWTWYYDKTKQKKLYGAINYCSGINVGYLMDSFLNLKKVFCQMYK